VKVLLWAIKHCMETDGLTRRCKCCPMGGIAVPEGSAGKDGTGILFALGDWRAKGGTQLQEAFRELVKATKGRPTSLEHQDPSPLAILFSPILLPPAAWHDCPSLSSSFTAVLIAGRKKWGKPDLLQLLPQLAARQPPFVQRHLYEYTVPGQSRSGCIDVWSITGRIAARPTRCLTVCCV
jgi:hypothetical protein